MNILYHGEAVSDQPDAEYLYLQRKCREWIEAQQESLSSEVLPTQQALQLVYKSVSPYLLNEKFRQHIIKQRLFRFDVYGKRKSYWCGRDSFQFNKLLPRKSTLFPWGRTSDRFYQLSASQQDLKDLLTSYSQRQNRDDLSLVKFSVFNEQDLKLAIVMLAGYDDLLTETIFANGLELAIIEKIYQPVYRRTAWVLSEDQTSLLFVLINKHKQGQTMRVLGRVKLFTRFDLYAYLRFTPEKEMVLFNNLERQQ